MRTLTIMALAVTGLAVTRSGLPHVARASRAPSAASDFQWHGVVAPGKTIEIRGVNGDVTAEPATGNEVEVTATKHARRSDPEDVRIEVVPHDGNITICAVYPTPNGRRPNTCEPGGGRNNTRNNDVSVDFTVRVPAGVNFDGNTVNGDVEATALTARADASTVNGSVTVETRGTASGRTVNGSVHVRMGSADWTDDLEFETVNGGITVTLPPGLNAELDAETVNGSIQSDFPVTVQGRLAPHSMHGVVGSGGRRLKLKTVNGSITLQKAS